jgi:hypothetical protein
MKTLNPTTMKVLLIAAGLLDLLFIASFFQTLWIMEWEFLIGTYIYIGLFAALLVMLINKYRKIGK